MTGLTAAEVHERVAAGRTNAVTSRTSRPVWEILRANVFTWFNLVLGTLLVLILIHGSWRDGLFGLVLLVNSAIGVAQEMRAKRTLDRLALLTAPHARVVRDGATIQVGIEHVVLDDVVALAPGDQLVVDGEILTSAGLELDESALTGEANPVPRSVGDTVRSGSFAVAGSGLYRATAVGEQAWAVRVERIGRRFARTESDIMGGINAILKVIGVLLVPVGALTVFRNAQHAETSTAVTDTVAALVAMVPEGLVLLSSIAFAVSALALARRHVLMNELSAVEVLARTDVVCVDKTGTLTDREPRFLRFDPVDGAAPPSSDPSAGLDVPSTDGPPPAALAALGALVRCEPAPNSTVRAIAAAVPGPPDWQPLASVPFSSARKWSAASFGPHGCWVLGAPDVLLREAPAADTVTAQLDALIAEDVRVLLLARAPALAPGTALPGPIEPVGFVGVLPEQSGPMPPATVGYGRPGHHLRVISGDDAARPPRSPRPWGCRATSSTPTDWTRTRSGRRWRTAWCSGGCSRSRSRRCCRRCRTRATRWP